MATRNEKDTTRARANILREFLTHSNKKNKFDHEEIKEVMDLCLSCKGCKSDCPSNVDVAMMKAEFLHQYYKSNGTPISARGIGYVAKVNKLFSPAPWLYNLGSNLPGVKQLIKKTMNISPKRELPKLHKFTLRKWYKRNYDQLPVGPRELGDVYLFADEIINYNDVEIGIAAISLLRKLGYNIIIPKHEESGRPAISKGLLDYGKKIAGKNVTLLKDLISEKTPLIGIEPSGILTFRDEYPKLLNGELRSQATTLAKNTLLIDEFIAREIDAEKITPAEFSNKNKQIKLHGHCMQKALSDIQVTKKILELPINYKADIIPSGCCGMSGSFGYDKDKYDLSMQIGEMVLFPAIRKAENRTIIAATGTSCRHQIKDGTDEIAQHPVQILFEALK
jgi:Fe-S oxidoreductase